MQFDLHGTQLQADVVGNRRNTVLRAIWAEADRPPTSAELALAWKPYIETCIDLFGPRRCMFESDFPPDKCGVSARVLWNAFKRLSMNYTEEEKVDLFAGTAVRCYRLPERLALR